MKEKSDQLPQHQNRQPSLESEMTPKPASRGDGPYHASNKLQGKVALITGGDSGIGRATGIDFAKEGANIGVIYFNEHEDARETERLIKEAGGRCPLISGDVGNEEFGKKVVEITIHEFGRLDILVNNAGEQHPENDLEKITAEQLCLFGVRRFLLYDRAGASSQRSRNGKWLKY